MFQGKTVIVTGGTRGIGLEIVRGFLQNEAKVALLGSKEESVQKAIELLKKENEQYQVIGFFPTLSNEAEINDTFRCIYERFGSIDVLINNAGVSSDLSITDYTEKDYEDIMNLNVKAVYLCSKVAVPYLKESHGVILNTSSMVSIYGQPKGVLYPMSKFAVNGLTKSLARELAPFIRVNAVAPGIIETDMLKNLPKEVIEPLIASIPLKRIGTPKDVANAFLFLASEQASYITGVILQVDGMAHN